MSDVLATPGVSLDAAGLIALRRVALMSRAAPVLAALPGGFATRRKGHGLEVADMREYVSGDDLRHLDRGTTARTGKLHIRQFQEERDRVTLLVADFRPAMFWGLRRAFRSVAAAEVLALMGWDVVESGGRVALLAITPGDPVIIPPRGRVRGMLDVIGGMVQAHQNSLDAVTGGQGEDLPLQQALSRADRLVPSGSELIIASGFDMPGDGFQDRLDALARRRSPRLVLITAAEAGQMPAGRYPIRLQDGRHIRVYFDETAMETDESHREIAGRMALVLNASDTIETTARRLSISYPARRAA